MSCPEIFWNSWKTKNRRRKRYIYGWWSIHCYFDNFITKIGILLTNTSQWLKNINNVITYFDNCHWPNQSEHFLSNLGSLILTDDETGRLAGLPCILHRAEPGCHVTWSINFLFAAVQQQPHWAAYHFPSSHSGLSPFHPLAQSPKPHISLWRPVQTYPFVGTEFNSSLCGQHASLYWLRMIHISLKTWPIVLD